MQQIVGMAEEEKKISAAIKARVPALLIGETGTGKTTLAKVAAERAGRKVVRVNLDGGVTPDALIGRYQARGATGGGVETYYQEGVIPQAMREGAVLLLDEINAALPDTLFCLHALLEESPRLFIPETKEEVRAHEDFCVIATMNPSHDYAGTKGLNAALYSRFGMVIRFKKLEGANFLNALVSHVPSVSAGKAERICAVINECEELRKAERITTRLTLREAIAAARFSMDGLTLREAIESALIGKLEEYERVLLKTDFAKEETAPAETVAEVFAMALEAGKLRNEVEELKERIGELQAVEQVLRTLQNTKALSKVRANAKDALTPVTPEELAWNPEEVKPWGVIKGKAKS